MADTSHPCEVGYGEGVVILKIEDEIISITPESAVELSSALRKMAKAATEMEKNSPS